MPFTLSDDCLLVGSDTVSFETWNTEGHVWGDSTLTWFAPGVGLFELSLGNGIRFRFTSQRRLDEIDEFLTALGAEVRIVDLRDDWTLVMDDDWDLDLDDDE